MARESMIRLSIAEKVSPKRTDKLILKNSNYMTASELNSIRYDEA